MIITGTVTETKVLTKQVGKMPWNYSQAVVSAMTAGLGFGMLMVSVALVLASFETETHELRSFAFGVGAPIGAFGAVMVLLFGWQYWQVRRNALKYETAVIEQAIEADWPEHLTL